MNQLPLPPSPKRRKLNDLKVSSLQTSLKDDSLSDITFIVKDERIPAIRSLFAASSDKLRRILYADLEKKQFEIENVNPDAFKWIKRFIYLSDPILTIKLIPILLDAVNTLNINSIKNYIENELNEISNCEQLIQLIISFESSNLSMKYQKKIFNVIRKCSELLQNYQNLLTDDRLLNISPVFIKALLKCISGSDKLNYKFIKIYCQRDDIHDEETINLLTEFLTLKELAKILQKDIDFNDSQKLHILTNAVLRSS